MSLSFRQVVQVISDTKGIAENSLVSVVVPVYNGALFLDEAIANIKQQHYKPLEIIVIDDGSTDRTPEIAQSYAEVRYYRQENLGPAAARNRGVRVSRGEFIAFQDVDDLWPKDRLQILLKSFQDNAIEIALGCTQLMRLRETDEGKNFQNSGAPFITFIFGCALLRRCVFERVGFLDESMRFSEDVDWFMRAREKEAPMAVIDEVTLFYRLHDANTTHGKDLAQKNFLNALKKSLDRRRMENHEAAQLPSLLAKGG